MKDVQEFVRELVAAPDAQLARLPLPEELVAEIKTARGMKKGALKRQVGFISKRLGAEPVDELRLLLEQMRQPASRANAHFHRIEGWRDSLLQGDETVLHELVESLNADRRHLRTLIHQAKRERESGSAPRASRQLFRYLRELAGADGGVL